MRSFAMKMFAWVLVCGLVLGAVGCGKATPTPTPTPTPTAPAKEAAAPKAESTDHDHDHDHDHEDDDHAHSAKYGGTLVEVGDHVGQMEFLLDPATGKLTVYAMDGHAENPVRLAWTEFKFDVVVGDAAPVAVAALPVASPLTGETVGDSAQFEAMVEALKGAEKFKVQVPPFEYRGVQVGAMSFDYPAAAH